MQITHAETLPDIVIASEASSALEANKTYVFQHKQTSKWLTVTNGKLALTDTKPVTGSYARYASQYFTLNANGQLAYTLTDVNDPSTGFSVEDGNGDAFFAPQRRTEEEVPVVYLKDQTDRYVIYYNNDFYSVSVNTHAATQWYAYEATPVGHHFENGSCIYEGCSAQITHRVPTYNTEGDPKSGIASWSTTLCKETVVPVTSSAEQVTWNAGWYHVSGNVTLTQGAVCNGAVHLILCDGAKLTVSNSTTNQAGICVTGYSNSLTIYAQSEGTQMGELEATGSSGGAGIGGGYGGNGQYITINGGKVTATGDFGAAGIGGGIGDEHNGECTGGVGLNITINGGTVTATGGDNASGIGNGFYSESAASNIYISTACGIKAGSSESDAAWVSNPTAGKDLASDLAGKKYVATHPHTYNTNGFCIVCTDNQLATKVTEQNYSELGLTSAYVGYYAIQNAGHLYWFAGQNNGASVVLTADINTENKHKWTPITIASGKTFDGNNHYIGGFDNQSFGLIEENNGTIKNLGLKSSSFSETSKTYNYGMCGNNKGTITNCYVDGVSVTVSPSEECQQVYAGALCHNNTGTITNCYAVNVELSAVGQYFQSSSSRVAAAHLKLLEDTGEGGNQEPEPEPVPEPAGDEPCEASSFKGVICSYNTGTITNCYTTDNTPVCSFNGTDSHVATKTADEFASGEVTWLLNGSVDAQDNWTAGPVDGTQTWYQKLPSTGSGQVGEGVNTTPVLTAAADGSNTVYGGYDGCEATTMTYTNDANKKLNPTQGHNLVSGTCTYCNLSLTYRVPAYNTAGDPTSGIASWNTMKRTEAATQVFSSTEPVTWNAGWYYVSGNNVTLTQGAVCNGDVHLILCDGAKLNVSNTNANQAGICVSGTDNSLTIYAQSEGEQVGSLVAVGGKDGAGIGGGKEGEGKNIFINGGAVTAEGGSIDASGIGNGAKCLTEASNIFVNIFYGVKAGPTAEDCSWITNNGRDLASLLNGKRYVTTHLHNISVEPAWTWADDGSNAMLTFTCAGGDAIVLDKASTPAVNITSAITTEPECTLTGIRTYSASVSFFGTTYNAPTHGVVVPALGHNFDANGANVACTRSGCNAHRVAYRVPTYNSGIASWRTDSVVTYNKAVTSSDSTVTWTAGWYFVEGNVTLSKGAVCSGNVHLILFDGAQLMSTGYYMTENDNCAGICVSGTSNSLTIYAQSEGSQMGALTANGGDYVAGIGGGYDGDGSNITINGGKVTANGGYHSAGIGGGNYGSGSNITINGGEVAAFGSPTAIGCGNFGKSSNIKISTCLVVLADDIAKPTTEIANNGGDLASALNAKSYATIHKHHYVNGECTFNRCTSRRVAYRVPTYNTPGNPASGIASWCTDSVLTYGAVNSSATSVTWTAGWYYVSGEVSLAQGAVCSGDVHLILCDGAQLTSTGFSSSVGSNNVAGIQVAGSNSLTIYAQSEGSQMGALTATGGNLTAGIGGGHKGLGSNITINGGKVTATGRADAAGIGGGYQGSGSNITINGGKVTATGGIFAAGIGGGFKGSGSNITINGGKVTATGRADAAGIGGGYQGSGSNIIISTDLTIYADEYINPTTEIANDGSDLASVLADKMYVSMHKHDYSGRIFSTTPDACGLYTYICSWCGRDKKDVKVIKDFAPNAVGDEKNIELSCDSQGNLSLQRFDITDANQLKDVNAIISVYEFPTYTRTMTSEWGTLVVPFAVTTVPEGFTFYRVTSLSSNGELYLREIKQYVDAGTSVFVRRKGEETSLLLTASSKTVNTTLPAASGNVDLQGAYESVVLNKTDHPNAYFVYNDLLYNTSQLGNANHVTIMPFHAYLSVTTGNASPRLVIRMDDENTCIDAIDNQQLTIENCFNLQGQRLSAPQRGINVINGCKVMIK